MESNPYESPREQEKPAEEEPKKSKRSGSTICLSVSGVWLFVTGFAAALPGGYWGLFLMSLIFGIPGLFMAETRTKRVIGGLLVILSLTGIVLDVIEGKRWKDERRWKQEQLSKPSGQVD